MKIGGQYHLGEGPTKQTILFRKRCLGELGIPCYKIFGIFMNSLLMILQLITLFEA